MGKYSVVVEKRAQKELQSFYKAGNNAIIKKIAQIFEDLENHPETGVGQPERLKYNFSGLWSRRINKKDRIVYRIDDAIITVFVISASGHYDDK